jgi:hypothetical protein
MSAPGIAFGALLACIPLVLGHCERSVQLESC